MSTLTNSDGLALATRAQTVRYYELHSLVNLNISMLFL